MSQEIINYILEQNDNGEGILTADGFDEAILGLDYSSNRVIYSVKKCINILVDSNEFTQEDAIEYLEYNTFNAYVGEKTPIWCNDIV